MGWPRFAGAATGALSRAPYMATNRVRGAPKWCGDGTRTIPLGPSVDFSLGPRRTRGGRQHWGLRKRANHPTGAFGGAPYMATSRVRGAPKWGGEVMRAIPLGPLVELPMGSRAA